MGQLRLDAQVRRIKKASEPCFLWVRVVFSIESPYNIEEQGDGRAFGHRVRPALSLKLARRLGLREDKPRAQAQSKNQQQSPCWPQVSCSLRVPPSLPSAGRSVREQICKDHHLFLAALDCWQREAFTVLKIIWTCSFCILCPWALGIQQQTDRQKSLSSWSSYSPLGTCVETGVTWCYLPW